MQLKFSDENVFLFSEAQPKIALFNPLPRSGNYLGIVI
jgi:hypothetical protein